MTVEGPATANQSAMRARVVAWLPEVSLFVLGVVLRVSMHFNYDPIYGYDFAQHLEVAQWMVDHGSIPTAKDVYCGYHPPLYYAVAAFLMKLGAQNPGIQWAGIVMGVIRLGLVWLGLAWFMPSRAARLAGLAMAAILPVSIHIDGMVTNEVASGLFATAALVVVPKAFSATGARRWVLTALIGVLISAQLLSKVSALVCIATIGLAVVFEFAVSGTLPWKTRITRALAWSLVVLLPVVLTGWYFMRNVPDWGKPFVSSMDTQPGNVAKMAPYVNTPLWKRRPAAFFVRWEPKIFDQPYYSVGSGPNASFWSVITAGTFVDYFNYDFHGDQRGELVLNDRPITQKVVTASKLSMGGGVFISIVVLVAWVVAFWRTLKDRNAGRLTLLALPAFALLYGLYLSTAYPLDDTGIMKSSYLQFGLWPLYGVFGLAAGWLFERRKAWPVLFLLGSSTWLVLAYSVYCRLRIPLLPF